MCIIYLYFEMFHRTIYKTSAGNKKRCFFLLRAHYIPLDVATQSGVVFEIDKVMWAITPANKSSNYVVKEHDP